MDNENEPASVAEAIAEGLACSGMDAARAAQCGAAVEAVVALVHTAAGGEAELALALVVNAVMVIVDGVENPTDALDAVIGELVKGRAADRAGRDPEATPSEHLDQADDHIDELYAAVKDAGGVVRLHGQPIEAAELRAAAVKSAADRLTRAAIAGATAARHAERDAGLDGAIDPDPRNEDDAPHDKYAGKPEHAATGWRPT